MRIITHRGQLVAYVFVILLGVVLFYRQEDTNRTVASVAKEAAINARDEGRAAAITECEGRRRNAVILLQLVDRTGGTTIPTDGLDPAVLKLLEQSRQSAAEFRLFAHQQIEPLPDCGALPRPTGAR